MELFKGSWRRGTPQPLKDADFTADLFVFVIDDGCAAEIMFGVGSVLFEGLTAGCLEISGEMCFTFSERTAIDLAVASGCRLFSSFIRLILY